MPILAESAPPCLVFETCFATSTCFGWASFDAATKTRRLPTLLAGAASAQHPFKTPTHQMKCPQLVIISLEREESEPNGMRI